MYQPTKVTNDEARAIIRQSKDWTWFCENRHGSVHWNKVTGEIVWLAEEEGDSNYQKLVAKE